MTPEIPTLLAPTRISIIARIVPVFSYLLPALGAAVSALLLKGVMAAMRTVEGAGIAVAAAGISEANLAILVTLYLAILVGIAGVVIGLVRMFTTTVTASPSAWYFLVAGVLGVAPMFALWRAQSLLLDVLISRTVGIAAVAGQINLFSIVAAVLGIASVFVLLVSAFVPLPRILFANRKWASLIMLLIMETVIIVMTVVYHLRTAWLYSGFRDF